MNSKPDSGLPFSAAWKSCCCVALLMLLFGHQARATSIRELSLEEMVAEADQIVHARVLAVWEGYDERTRIPWTHYGLQIVEELKGDRVTTLVVSEPAGRLGSVIVDIAGVPRYAVNEEVLVFLKRTPGGFLRTLNLTEGKLRIIRGDDQQKYAIGSPSLFRRPGTAKTVKQLPARRFLSAERFGFTSRVLLSDLKQQIRQLVGQ